MIGPSTSPNRPNASSDSHTSTTWKPFSPCPLTRRYTSFSQAVDEIVDARVWFGIHFRIADVHGAKIGRQIARYRRQHYFNPTKPGACEKDHGGDGEHDDEEDREDHKPDN